jgi:hypothetical protein
MHAVELARLKHLLKFVIDSNDAITKDPNVSHADRLKSEIIKLEALAMLQVAITAGIATIVAVVAIKKPRSSDGKEKEDDLVTPMG